LKLLASLVRAYMLFLVVMMALSVAPTHDESAMNAFASESMVVGVIGTTCDGGLRPNGKNVIPFGSGTGTSQLVIKQQYVSVSSPGDSVTTRLGYLYETPGGRYRFQPFKNHGMFATDTFEHVSSVTDLRKGETIRDFLRDLHPHSLGPGATMYPLDWRVDLTDCDYRA
jgi:hypothetical protein